MVRRYLNLCNTGVEPDYDEDADSDGFIMTMGIYGEITEEEAKYCFNEGKKAVRRAVIKMINEQQESPF